MITCHKKYLEQRCQERGYTWEEVLPCVVSQDGDEVTVDIDHPAYPRVTRTAPQDGPGSELKALLAKIGITASPTCQCNTMATTMNRWGESSLDHIEEIVDVMEQSAKDRGLPFLRAVGRQLVKLAVRRWKKANSQ